MRKIALFICLLIIAMGGFLFFQPETPTHKAPTTSSDIHLSIPSPQNTLRFFELTNNNNTLHPDWYALINPIAYVVTNGIIQSVCGYLLLDLNQPLHLALQWEKEDDLPTLLLSLPSQQGFQGAHNLSRNLKPYGTIQENLHEWHGNIKLPQLPPSSLSWKGTKKQIILAWRPYPSTNPFDLSIFANTTPPTTNTIHGKQNHQAFQWMQKIPLSEITIDIHITERSLILSGTGKGTTSHIPAPSYPLEMIAGWNVPEIPPMQIHKTTASDLCFAGSYKQFQSHTNIDETCPLVSTQGIYVFFSKDFFSHIGIPLQHIELVVQGDPQSLRLEGSIIKEETRGLFSLYVWLAKLIKDFE